MRACVWVPGSEGVTLTEIADPSPEPGEVLAEPVAVGLCGTDREIIHGEHPVTQQVVDRDALPYLVPGHEWSARIAGLGSGVRGFEVGDRVVGEVGIACSHDGQPAGPGPASPTERQEIGISRHGAMAEYLTVPATVLHRIPPSISWSAGALIEPLSVAVRAVSRLVESDPNAPVSLPRMKSGLAGKSAVVWGDGTIGLLVAQVLEATGAGFVGLVAMHPAKQEIATRVGVEAVFLRPDTPGPAWLRDQHPLVSEGPDIAVEAAGHVTAVAECFEAVKDRGSVLLVGFPGVAPVDVTSLALREILLKGSRSGDGAWEAAIELAATNAVQLDELVTARYELSDVASAFDSLERDDTQVKRIVKIRAVEPQVEPQ